MAVSLLAVATHPAPAQEPDSSGAHADVPGPPTGDASRLQPRRMIYALWRTTDSASIPLGERVVELRATDYAGVPAWSLVERLQGTLVSTGEDSLLLRRTDLSPLRWQSTLGSSRLAAEFARDTLYVALQGPGIRRSATTAVPPHVVPSAGALERWLETVALDERWLAEVQLLLVDLGGARVVDGTMEVEGSASVSTPLGEWDAWRVVLRAAGAEKRFWIRKTDPLVLRTYQILPGSGGEALESLLQAEEHGGQQREDSPPGG